MKRILTTLFTLAIIMAGSVPALAAGEETSTGQSVIFYPISVEEYTYGEAEEPRINKVYQLSLSDDPSGIPTEDFVRNGRQYYLLDMTRKNEVGVDTKPHIETVTQASSTDDMETILQQLSAELEVTTEDGYTGTLQLWMATPPRPRLSLPAEAIRTCRRRMSPSFQKASRRTERP